MTGPNFRDQPRLRKAIFVIANLAALVVVTFLIVMPIDEFFAERRSQIANQRALLARLKAIVAQEPDIQAIEQATAQQLKRGEFIVGANAGMINADLQSRLKAKAVQSGAQLRAVQALSPRTSAGVRYLGTQLEIYGPLRAIQRTLHAIETGTPYNFIVAAVIKPSPAAHARAASAEPTIEARLEIFVAVQLDGQPP